MWQLKFHPSYKSSDMAPDNFLERTSDGTFFFSKYLKFDCENFLIFFFFHTRSIFNDPNQHEAKRQSDASYDLSGRVQIMC